MEHDPFVLFGIFVVYTNANKIIMLISKVVPFMCYSAMLAKLLLYLYKTELSKMDICRFCFFLLLILTISNRR